MSKRGEAVKWLRAQWAELECVAVEDIPEPALITALAVNAFAQYRGIDVVEDHGALIARCLKYFARNKPADALGAFALLTCYLWPEKYPTLGTVMAVGADELFHSYVGQYIDSEEKASEE